ncbi:hypothetical protein AB1K70_01640 [Bremerella sp. JC770]|uniref:hypothetical protein n=1 Tax=Bremerella sp. JC770 TaxID=3232137 RepID=UPI00345A7D0B
MSNETNFSQRLRAKVNKVAIEHLAEQEDEIEKEQEPDLENEDGGQKDANVLAKAVCIGQHFMPDEVIRVLTNVEEMFPGGVMHLPATTESYITGQRKYAIESSYDFNGDVPAAVQCCLECEVQCVTLLISVTPDKSGRKWSPHIFQMSMSDFLEDRSEMVNFLERVIIEEIDGFVKTAIDYDPDLCEKFG